MVRQIIHIDEDKCNGCGLCARVCHEGAIDLVDGKAKLMREHFCDGLGDCLPNCPTGAITFEQREAPAYDEAAVKASQQKKAEVVRKLPPLPSMPRHSCPGSRAMSLNHDEAGCDEPVSERPGVGRPIPGASMEGVGITGDKPSAAARPTSRLQQWPCQIKLLPVEAPFFQGAKLLIAADCTAYAYADMHEKFMRGKVTVIGCPKLDDIDYSEKLTAIIRDNDIKSVTIVRMDVPCCGGLQRSAEKALRDSGKFIPWQVVTIGRNGRILDS